MQAAFERRDVEGTLVALWAPDYAQGINMAGWHMHFLSADRGCGGHVLEVSLERGQAAIASLRRFEMVLPTGGRFAGADLSGT